RCAQTARISLHKTAMSKSHRQTKNVRSASFLAYPFAPCLQIFRTVASVPVRFRPSPSRLRFGEGVFTDAPWCPQEGKAPSVQNFFKNRKTPQNLVVGARIPTIDAALRQFSCDDSNDCPWVRRQRAA
ncbi:MAG TPA: hypothetical protein PKA03_01135, partial [Tabrizicola sp.]|nr:hypothetical protein [Tabrizicola sp.]